MNLRRLCATMAAVALVGLMGPWVASANMLANPGFEEPITYDGPPFVGYWEGFQGPPVSLAANSTAMPLSGEQNLELAIDATANTFAGVFQDVPNLTPGMSTVFSGWHMTPSDPFDVGVEIRIEWRDSVTDTEISRTPNMTTPPTGQYTEFMLEAVVPEGADTARCVYAIQSFGGLPTNTGTVYVDDTSFVPEPSSLLLLGGLVLVACRRRG